MLKDGCLMLTFEQARMSAKRTLIMDAESESRYQPTLGVKMMR